MAELATLVLLGLAHEELAGRVVVVERDGTEMDGSLLRSIPAVLVAADNDPSLDPLVDLRADGAALDEVADAVQHHPDASIALALLLRGSLERSVEDGLVAESVTYSMLQGGPEFAAWLRSNRPPAPLAEIGPAVRVESGPGVRTLTLSRPHVHNALGRRLRDELCDALTVALDDPAAPEVVLRGAGPSFCSGGDLSEFGSFPDPASAHRTRLARHPARLMARLAERTTVFLHGACLGAGIELPAFARRGVADSSASIGLPEISLGLIPGAGGTVSLPRRIGRHRTAWLALTGARVDARTALAWGLVDEVLDSPGSG